MRCSISVLMTWFTEEEIEKGVSLNLLDRSRIYKVVSFDDSGVFFVPSSFASPIKDQVEFKKNKSRYAVTGEMIKEICLPLEVDRLGNIIKVGI